MALREHDPRGIEGRIVLLRDNVQKSIRDPEISRLLGLAVTRACPWRDDRCELEAIWYFMHKNIRYTGDIAGYDTFQTARRTLQYRGGDCLPAATKLMTPDGPIALHALREGVRIWGRDRWSNVTAVWFKDVLPLDQIVLSNGKAFMATGGHKIFVAQDDGVVVRREVSQLELGMNLIRPSVFSYLLSGGGAAAPTVTSEYDWKPLAKDHEKTWSVIAVNRNFDKGAVFDLTTDDHYVYLPEADVVISQCDDGSVLIAALALGNGFSVKFRITKNTRLGSYAHIYSQVGFPKHNPRTWIPLDWTLGHSRFGAHPPQASFVEFDGHQAAYNREITPQSYEGW